MNRAENHTSGNRKIESKQSAVGDVLTDQSSATLTAAECAALINVSYQSVLRLIQRKKLRCLPLRHKIIPRFEVERFLKEEIR